VIFFDNSLVQVVSSVKNSGIDSLQAEIIHGSAFAEDCTDVTFGVPIMLDKAKMFEVLQRKVAKRYHIFENNIHRKKVY
jgi:hypothetical protein